jgi:MoaA/NifB/PqqE/SkfB family radical SAM enzyme
MAAPLRHGAAPRHRPRDYSQTPLNVYWEVTQACALACRHCRAEAVPHHHPLELSHEEGVRLLRQIAEFGDPIPYLILTGGDPLEREDLYELIDEARAFGIGVSITPAATDALTRDTLVKLKDHGIEGLGLSLDGSTPDRHDSIRQVPGTFARTMRAMEWAKELGIPLQVNTLAAAQTADDIPAIYELLEPMAVARWSMFFLISVGRGKVLEPLEPEAAERLMAWIHDTSRRASFIVATTEAPSYRRVALERMREEGPSGEAVKQSGVYRASASATATASCSSRTRATSVRRAFCRWWWAMSAKTTSWMFTAMRPCFAHCTTRPSLAATAASANTMPSAAARGRGRMRRREIRWPKTLSASTSRKPFGANPPLVGKRG